MEQHDGEEKADHRGKEREQQGFSPELPHQLTSFGPEDLSDPDFDGPRCGAADGKGDEIDTGDQQDEETDSSQDIRVFGVTDRLDAGRQGVVEMDGGERLEVKIIFFVWMWREEGWKSGFQSGLLGGAVKKDIGLIEYIAPAVQHAWIEH
jgi:hypothetical protein